MSQGPAVVFHSPNSCAGQDPALQGRDEKMAEGVMVGIDVSKARLDVAVLEPRADFSVSNDAAGWAELRRRLAGQAVAAVGLEASGGYERGVVGALVAAGLPVRRVNPHRLRLFARAEGVLAKNDLLDARVIARFVAKMPTRAAQPDPAREALTELVIARRRLTEERVRLVNRADRPLEPLLRRMTERRLRRLTADIVLLERRIAELIAADPILAAKDRLIRSLPGAGPVLSFTLIACLPELGDLDRRQIAALAGLAPYDHDSGKLKGRRRIWGGRAEVRCAAYMATLSAIRCNARFKAFHQHLVSAGKPPKLALLAGARKLLAILGAMLKAQTPWNPAMA